MAITVKTLAHAGAAIRLHDDALENLRMMYDDNFHSEGDNFQVLFFLTGGSEAAAIECLDEKQFQLLLASGKSNAYASATEIKAYSNQKNYHNELLNLDDAYDRSKFERYVSVLKALDQLKGKRLGLIGEVSEWLVASSIDDTLLKEKLGVELVRIPWNEAGDFKQQLVDEKFKNCFHAGRQYDLEEAGKVNSLLKKIIDEHKLDAITVECFSLVQENEVTACLSLSCLNDLGIPAGCEGDLCSIVGMMIMKELFGEVPWMANVASITGDELLLAHCTAPTSVLSEYHINTHYETGKGTAIHGRYKDREVTIFRLNSTLDKIFCAQGEVVDGRYEKHACRTQMHVRLDDKAIRELKENPLGNHHLVMAGDRTAELECLRNIMKSVDG